MATGFAQPVTVAATCGVCRMRRKVRGPKRTRDRRRHPPSAAPRARAPQHSAEGAGVNRAVPSQQQQQQRSRRRIVIARRCTADRFPRARPSNRSARHVPYCRCLFSIPRRPSPAFSARPFSRAAAAAAPHSVVSPLLAAAATFFRSH